ncbi:MAG: ATP-binding protein [Alphaproteobacteria bacterium]
MSDHPESFDAGERNTVNVRRLRGAARALVAGLLIASFAATGLEIYYEREELLDHAHREAGTIARSMAENTRFVLEITDLALLQLARQAEQDLADDGDLDTGFGEMVASTIERIGTVQNILVLGRDGRPLASTFDNLPTDLDFSDRSYFKTQRDLQTTGLFVGPPITGRIQNLVVVPLSRRISGADGSFAGVVMATIGPGYFTSQFSALDVGRRGAILLAHESGTVIARFPANDTAGMTFADRPLFTRYLKDAPYGTYVSPPQSDGEVRITGYHRVERSGLVVAVAIHRGEILAPLYRQVYYHAAGLLLLTVFLSGALLYVQRFLNREEFLLGRLREERQGHMRRAMQQRAVSVLNECARENDLPHEFLANAAQVIRETLNADLCHILQAMPEHDRFQTLAEHGLTGADDVSLRTVDGDFTHAGKCLDTGKPLVTVDYAGERRFKPSVALGRDEARSGVVAPFRLDGKRGVLGVYSREPGAFQDGDTVFLESVAYLVSSYFERLREYRLRKAVLDGVSASICVLDPRGRILLVNEGWQQFGVENGMQASRAWSEVNYLDVCDAATEPEAEMIADAIRGVVGGNLERFSLEYPCHPPGGTRWFRVLISPVPLDEGVGAVVMHVDITEVVAAERDAERMKDRLETLVREAKVGILVHSDFKPLVANDELAAILGYRDADEILALQDIRELFADEEGERLSGYYGDRISGALPPGLYSVKGKRRDGAGIELENRAFPIDWGTGRAVCAMLTDVTEQRLLEVRMREAHRIEAVGQLSGGIAHDFNNLLTVILGSAEVLFLRDDADEMTRKLASVMMHAAKRGADLTNRLLSFARRQPLDLRPSDLAEMFTGIEELLRRTLGEDIDLSVDIAEGLWPALVDVAQLESAIVNLCVNARDAMPGGGYLTVETRNAHLDEKYASQHVDVQPGDYVMIAVTDSGSGMDEETLSRAFDPFFTTKEVGQGTGLGLSMVFGFIKQSNGHVRIYSEVNSGTTVKLYLPRATDKALEPDGAAQEPPGVPGEARILLVEDDDLVREYVFNQLERLGYTVTAARNGSEALAILEGGKPFDLLFTDVVMPGGMSGKELAERVNDLRPGMPVLFTSGYAESAIVHQGRLDQGVVLLAKPYTIAELARKVASALNGKDSN